MGHNNEKLGSDNIKESEIREEGIKFIENDAKDEGILTAIGHNQYYLPNAFCNVSAIDLMLINTNHVI